MKKYFCALLVMAICCMGQAVAGNRHEIIKNGDFEKRTGFSGQTYGIKLKDLHKTSPNWDKFVKVPHWNESEKGNVIAHANNNLFLQLNSEIAQYIDLKPGTYQIQYKVAGGDFIDQSLIMRVFFEDTEIDTIFARNTKNDFEARKTQIFTIERKKNKKLEFSMNKISGSGFRIDDIEVVAASADEEGDSGIGHETNSTQEDLSSVIKNNESFFAKNITFTPPWLVIYDKNNEPAMLIDSNGNLFFPGVVDESNGVITDGDVLTISRQNQSQKNLNISKDGDMMVSGIIYQNTQVFPDKSNVVIVQNKQKETLAMLDPGTGDIYIKGNYELPDSESE